ncbi:two-component system response regulator YesN [Paenibacillus cellulosilyticus]|uniref:Two-component system response regulator YesN n=1 Tax=Paenibacillus cellulosilyticus TaxID=375489 RepID=A0A2V2YD65_9BACL|nr:response regulator transcription factor [Paenibacillus cellulosilyticus]PWV88443.1 two-component system response regulator YesN [Paenibacillus cellulosilyticus]QKS44290.1 response regulator transcription factor [Paenibacillus cellulosilyticus]
MYKVLIVDDEPSIREGMTTLIEWESFGFEVCGTAANGREALAKADELQPDLMLVDIRMPGINGLELIERIREKGSDCHFLILSGYSDFDYAKKAIGFRVDGYLLKPVDEKELCESLARIRDRLIEEKEQKRQQESELAWRGEQLIASVVTGTAGDSLSEDLWGPISQRLDLDWSSYRVAVVEVDLSEEDESGVGLLKSKWSRELDREQSFAFLAEPYIGILLRADEKGEAQWHEALRALLNNEKVPLYISVGSKVDSFLDVRHSYEQAVEGMRQRFVLGMGVIVQADDAGEKRSAIEPGELDDYADQLFLAMDIGNKDSAVRTIEALAERMTAARLDEETVKSSFAQMASVAFNKLAAANPKTFTSAHSFGPVISDVIRQRSLQSLISHLSQAIEGTVRYSTEHSPETIIKQVEDFIRRHSSENLKLETIAELFNYNSSYLGKLFKTHTGEYFNTYLDKVRIEKAKELLAQGLKVHQAAERVGYASVDYFHTKFKKYEGVSPSAFKGRPS